MKKSLALILAFIMVLCLLPVTALAAKPGTKEVTIKLAYSDYVYEPTGSKGFTYTYSNPLNGGSGWIYTLGPVEQYVTSQEMSGYTFTGYSVMEKSKRVSKMPGDTWDLGQGYGGQLHVLLEKGGNAPTSSTLQVNTVITGDQTLTSNGTPFPVNVGTGYIPDNYKTGLDNSNYTYTFVKAERKSGTGLFKTTASSSSGEISTENKYRQFFPASGANVVTVYYTAKTLMTPGKPSDNDIYGIVGDNAVKVHCTNVEAGHEDKTYALIAGSFNIGDVTKDNASGKYFCNITVHAGKYVDKYNNTYGSHTLDQNEGTAVIKLEYNNGKWERSLRPLSFST